jgi:cation diffusion facilitator family transporter
LGKFLAGSISKSIAITADAFNNLSDAGSSLVSLIGFKLSGKKPEPEHPFGHGRLEYISGLVVSFIIILMGFELLTSSVSKIINPEPIEFKLLPVLILVFSILVKFYMAFYNSKVGKKINSTTLKATAADSLSDTIATTAVLVSTAVSHLFSINIDGYTGVLVAGMILFAGYNAAKDTISPLLGNSPDPEFVASIEQLVLSHDIAVGIHDLIVHDYGPGRQIISLHVEVPGNANIFEAHDEIDLIERTLKEKLNCDATIHMDPVVTDDETVTLAKQTVCKLVKQLGESVTIHDFRMVSGPTHTNLIFDVVVPFSAKMTDDEIKDKIALLVSEYNPSYFTVINVDRAYSKV